MDRRHMLGTVAAGAASMAFVKANSFAADKDVKGHEHLHHGDHLQKCMDTCASCMNECNVTAHYCYEKSQGSGKLLDAMHVAIDCQEFCGNSAKLIGRASPLMNIGCTACAAACEMCATECEKHGDDEQLARCAKECRTCAASCKEMVAHMGHNAAAAKEKAAAR
jgi:hypothetical protein